MKQMELLVTPMHILKRITFQRMKIHTKKTISIFIFNHYHDYDSDDAKTAYLKKMSYVVYYQDHSGTTRHFMIMFYVDEMYIPSFGRIFIGMHKKKIL